MIILVWTLYALLVVTFVMLVIKTRPLKREQAKIKAQSYKGHHSCREAYRALFSNLGL